MLSSCLNEEEKLVATAIMTDKSSLEFGIEDTLALALTVYADAPWTVESPSWVTVDPATGDAGETVVTVVVEPNVRENLPDRPRQDVLKFVGQDIYANAFVDVLQAGDKYRDLVELTMAEALALETDTFVGVKDVQVVALASNGFIAQDQTALSYVAADLEVELGDKGNVYAYVSSLNDLPSLAKGDKFVKASNSAVDYSSAKDITAELQAYKASQIELVSITGKYASKKIELYYEEGAERPSQPDSVVIEVMNPHESLAISQYDGWLVEAKGYTVGQGTNVVYFVPVEVKGVKSLETIYFSDDFSWIAPWADATGAADSVTDQLGGTSGKAPNVYTGVDPSFLQAFADMGYEDLNPGSQVLYLQKYYLKMCKGDHQTGLKLPALSNLTSPTNVTLTFDWCAHMGAAKKVDDVSVVVELEGEGVVASTGTKKSEAFETTQIVGEDEQGELFWVPATINLVDVTADTRIIIRPLNMGKKPSYQRWYIDNIKIIEYTGPVSVVEPTEAEVSISMENNIIFEAAQTEPITFDFESDQEATLTLGADWAFFIDADDKEVSSLTIAASTPTTVKVGAKEHTESEPRTTEITIESGLTVETIPVKQMSPGQKVEPFVSIVGGNGTKVSSDEGTLNLTVQSNVDFKVESDVAWATVEPVPATRAQVELTTYVVKYEANTVPEARTAHIRVFNAEKNLESVYTLEQAAFEVGVFFQDDFAWVAPFVDADIANGRTQGDSMLDNAQYGVKSSYDLDGFEQKLTELGYEALFPESKAIYVMKGNYLKFSKGKNTNGIRLPKTNFYGESTVALSFDWGINIGANGPDPVELEVVIEGNGTIDGQQKSAPIKHTAGDWEWQTETIIISGVDNNTRISIRPTAFTGVVDASGYYRWFLDNVKVEKYEGEVPGQVEPLNVSWLFSADAMNDATTGYAATFGTTAGVEDKTAGDGGQYVNANVSGNGKITYVQIDKTSLTYTSDKNGNPYKSTRITGATGQPYVTGMWIGDYWLFEATDGTTYPAGTKVNVSYLTRTSATGIRYWRLEYLDGADWKPAMEVSTIEGTDLQYNVAMNPDGKTDTQINAVVTLTNPTENVKFRMVCVGGTLANGKAIPEGINGGTCRIAGAEGTSPVIKVITE